MKVSAETEMRSSLGGGTPVQARRAWQAPTITELPIRTQTRVAAAGLPAEPENPPAPATPSTKLGFSFEMSLPLSVRTD
jgi:hypothetical protein